MKVPILSAAEARRYAQYVHSRFGVPEKVMREWAWARHKDSIFVLSHALGGVLDSNANIFAAGLQAFTDGKTFQPTSNFITLIGAHVKQNIVELSPVQVEGFFSHRKMDREHVKPVRVLSDGWVAVSFEGVVIGSASLTRNHLIPNLPALMHGSEQD